MDLIKTWHDLSRISGQQWEPDPEREGYERLAIPDHVGRGYTMKSCVISRPTVKTMERENALRSIVEKEDLIRTTLQRRTLRKWLRVQIRRFVGV